MHVILAYMKDNQIIIWNPVFDTSYLICSDQILKCLTVSAKAIPCVLGHAITIRCPVALSSSDAPRSVKEWFRGIVLKPEAMVAKLVTNGVHMEYNYTANEKVSISPVEGDLVIANLTLEDIGFYTCHFTGSKEQIIQLYVRGAFFKDISRASKMTRS